MTLHFSDLEHEAIVGTNSTRVVPNTSKTIYRSFLKRAFDIVSIVLFLPIVGTIVLLMAALVSFDGHNPFYSQMRVGKNGRHFRLWKIRTMTPDADDVLESYLKANPEARVEWDKHQKLKDDPRITRIGRFLRKASLDELPQLFNVLQGSMSLVGPRPMMLDQEQFYYGSSYYRLSPGLTGFWQISDRNETSFVARVKYDDAYERDLSFKTDLKTLFRTVSVVLRGTGY